MPSQTDARDMVAQFPQVFAQAKSDWEKYKLALATGTVPLNARKTVSEWFYDFPKLWAGIRPNWECDDCTEEDRQFAQSVNRWVVRLRGEPEFNSGLGIGPLLIAGIIVAGAFGVAGVTWAVGYVQEQRNITRLIDGVARGKISQSALDAAIEASEAGFKLDVPGMGAGLAIALVVGLVIIAPRVFGGRS